jgi:hypothetical protein
MYLSLCERQSYKITNQNSATSASTILVGAYYFYWRRLLMGKGSIRKTQKKRLKDGRGQGYGIKYKPFIQACDNKAPSEGYLTRELGWKTSRIHHTMSKVEYEYLMVLTWSDLVVDIREQYPLTPIQRTIEIADQLGIPHAHYRDEKVHATTDFVISIETTEGIKEVVRTVKEVKDLAPRTIELFQIEKTYFEEQGVDWGIILDIHLPKMLVKNVEWMYEGKYLDSRTGLDEEMVAGVSSELFNLIVSENGRSAIQKVWQT